MKGLHQTIRTLSSKCTSRHELWIKLIQKENIRSVVEIGVYRGEFAEWIHRSCLGITTYIMIDPWRHLDTWNKPANKDDLTFEAYYQEAVARTYFAKDAITVYRETTAKASQILPDNTIDLAYVDGDHTLRGITIDLSCIYDKIVSSGIIAGDDFCSSIWQHDDHYEPTLVFPYVVYFAEAKGDHIYALPFNQFLIHKQPSYDFEFYDLTGHYQSTSILEHVRALPPKDPSLATRLIRSITRSAQKFTSLLGNLDG